MIKSIRFKKRMTYIDQSGNTFLITKRPTEEELSKQLSADGRSYTPSVYDQSMNHGTDFVSAIYKDHETPLWWDERFRVSQVYTGHGFQIRQAEYQEDLGEFITVSTVVGDGEGYGKVDGTLPNPDFTYYAIHRHSKEDGSRTTTWDFGSRKWRQPEEPFPDFFQVIHPKNSSFDLVPSQIKGTVERMWNEAIEDFPDFFDKTTGLKRNISLDSGSPITPSSDGGKKNEEAQGDDEITITAPKKFKIKAIDKITNFNPSTDTLEIDADSFGIGSTATFATGKNKKVVKKKLAKQYFDFLYDEKKGGLYFNENGADKGFGEGGIIAILKGAPDLTSDNLEFI